jgi:UDP-glucuronate decarboxylase
MHVLVTGAAGFLGSHLCDRLIRDGHRVTALDNFKTGRKSNLAHLANEKRFQLVEQDVIVPFKGKFEQIYNLACPASPPHYQSQAIWTLRTCFTGMDNMLQLAADNGARILQASTSEVYGDPAIHPQTEDYRGNVNPFGPRACYDEGKRVAEALCYEYHRLQGVEVKVARIFNTYGPRMDPADGRVISNFIVQALSGHDISLYGDGQQTRSFCYVDDLIEGFIRLMNSPKGFTGPVNLGNPVEFTVRQLAEMVIAMTGSASRIVQKPLPPDDPKLRRPDITMAINALGWRPDVPLKDGLTRTIAHFRAALIPAQ